VGFRPSEGDVLRDINLEAQRNPEIIWPREGEQSQVVIEHDECSVYNDGLTELVNSHNWIVWDKGEERDFIEDVVYHEKEIWNWEDALEM
jgi:hypothetical protein